MHRAARWIQECAVGDGPILVGVPNQEVIEAVRMRQTQMVTVALTKNVFGRNDILHDSICAFISNTSMARRSEVILENDRVGAIVLQAPAASPAIPRAWDGTAPPQNNSARWPPRCSFVSAP